MNILSKRKSAYLLSTELLRREWRFLRSLPPQVRAFFASILLSSIATPLLGVFTTAYMIRAQGNLAAVCSYELAWFIAIPIGFLLAGVLLRRYSSSQVFGWGLVAMGASTAIAAYISQLQTAVGGPLLWMSIAGFLSGGVAGIYWGARNLLTVLVTSSTDRNLFFSLESTLGVVCAVLVPITFGALLEYSFFIPSVISPSGAFWILLLSVCGSLEIGARQILRQRYETAMPNRIYLPLAAPPVWHVARVLLICKGTADCYSSFLPVVLTFSFLGKEFTLGLLQSLGGIISAAAVYTLGRIVGTYISRISITRCSCGITFGVSLFLAIDLSTTSAITFIVGTIFSMALLWNSTNPPILDLVESLAESPRAHYAFLVDREFSLSLGRAGCLILLIWLIKTMGIEPALSTIALYLAPLQIGLFWASGRIDHFLRSKQGS